MAATGATLRSTAKRVPDRDAPTVGDTRYTYAELDAHVDQVAGVPAAQGIGKGDRLTESRRRDRTPPARYAPRSHRARGRPEAESPGRRRPRDDRVERGGPRASAQRLAAISHLRLAAVYE
jgi:hypothetical protein